MTNRYFTTLSRGIGKDGEAYEDYKPRYPKEVPFSLCDLKIKNLKQSLCTGIKKYKKLPGTYLTEAGQILLYTNIKRSGGISTQASLVCKNIKELYDSIEFIIPSLKEQDLKCTKENNTLIYIPEALASLQNNWLYDQKWKSSGKEIIPFEEMNDDDYFLNYMKNKNQHNSHKVRKLKSKLSQVNEKTGNILNRKQSIGSNTFASFTNSPTNCDMTTNISNQKQNNALSSISRSDSLASLTNSPSTSMMSMETFTENQLKGASPKMFLNSIKGDQTTPKSPCDCYEIEDQLLIPINRKKILENLDYFNDDLLDSSSQLNITEALGEDFALNDVKRSSFIPKSIHSSQLTTRTRNTEELRIKLLKDLYKHLEYLISIQEILTKFGEIILKQFQEFNTYNREKRMNFKREEIYLHVKEMKQRNEEIFLRLCKVSENVLLEQKDSINKSSFYKKWDKMLIDLSLKAKQDNAILQNKIEKFIAMKELEMKEHEKKMIKVEHLSIKSSFIKLKDEMLKIVEKRQEIDHFIIRLEMRRENINKIHRDIESVIPPLLNFEKYNITELIISLKSNILTSWKTKMGGLSSDFNFNDKQFLDIKKIAISLDICLTDTDETDDSEEIKDTRIIENVNLNANSCRQTIEDWPTNEINKNNKTLPILTDKTSIKVKKSYLQKLDLNMLQQGQRISSNFTYSYFVPWRKETYESSSLDIFTDEANTFKEQRRSKKMLNYKKILAYNPLISKRTNCNLKEK